MLKIKAILFKTGYSSDKNRLNLFLNFVFLIIFLNTAVSKAQILKDSVSLRLVKKSIDNIYNMSFLEARESCMALGKSYPGHPVNYLLEGLTIYWENYPLSASSVACDSFEINLRKCIQLCEAKNRKADEAEFLLTNLSARGMLLLFYSDNDLSMDVIPLAASTYPYIRRSFDYTASYDDFFFFTGLYNYTREAYPEAYPVYKALAFLFPKGDKMKGLTELQLAARKSILFKAESSLFLAGISLTIENNYAQSYEYIKSLHELYPSNIEYTAIYLKDLLLIKEYEKAELLMNNSLTKTGNKYFQAQLSVFKGILREKKYHDDALALQYYQTGIKELSHFGVFADEYAAYGYFGLSRISGRKGEENFRKTYRKKAYELADFKKIDFD